MARLGACVVSYRQVRYAVAVEICRYDRNWVQSGWVRLCRAECAVAVPRHDAKSVFLLVWPHHTGVQVAVPIEVLQHDRIWILADAIAHGFVKRPVALAQ